MSGRKVTVEATKAETAILRMRKARIASVVANEMRWAVKLRELYNSLPEDVLRILLAGDVIEEADLDPENVPAERGRS